MSAKTFRPQDTVDFVIVGSGAAGGVMARELSRAGFDVVVMEQGRRLGPGDFEHDELKYWFRNGIMNKPEESPRTYRKLPTDKAERVQDLNALWYARIVGGSSNHSTGNFWRLRPVDFKERSLLGEIPGAGFADWPITCEELEPYYTKADWEIRVSGLAGKYLMFNQGAVAGAVFERELNEHKSVQVTRVLHGFYDSDPKRGFYGGGIDARINPMPIVLPLVFMPPEMSWGAPLKRALRDMPRTMLSTGHTTALALERNSVPIDPELKDAWGVPAIRVTYKEHPDDMKIAAPAGYLPHGR